MLTAVVALPEQSIMFNGNVLKNPPAHWTRLFFSDRYTHGPSLIKGEVRTAQQQNCVVGRRSHHYGRGATVRQSGDAVDARIRLRHLAPAAATIFI